MEILAWIAILFALIATGLAIFFGIKWKKNKSNNPALDSVGTIKIKNPVKALNPSDGTETDETIEKGEYPWKGYTVDGTQISAVFSDKDGNLKYVNWIKRDIGLSFKK